MFFYDTVCFCKFEVIWLFQTVFYFLAGMFHKVMTLRKISQKLRKVFWFESVLSLTVRLPGACALNIKPGQHLVITSICAESGSIITRSYTPIDIYENGHFKLLIKLYKNGKMGKILS